jgi:hypothetical protein
VLAVGGLSRGDAHDFVHLMPMYFTFDAGVLYTVLYHGSVDVA